MCKNLFSFINSLIQLYVLPLKSKPILLFDNHSSFSIKGRYSTSQFNKIVLIGPPGAGKSSIGKALAKELSLPFIDSDGEIEKSVGKKISEIFVDDGEPHFRVLEMEKVKQLLEDFVGVISLGGGAPINSEISQILESADYPVIFIDVSIAQAAVRIGFNKDRPLLLINPRQQWMNLMSERRPVYEKLATDTVSSDSKKPHEVAKVIVEKIKAKI